MRKELPGLITWCGACEQGGNQACRGKGDRLLHVVENIVVTLSCSKGCKGVDSENKNN